MVNLLLEYFNQKQYSQNTVEQRWSRGHKARGQGQAHKKISRPRPSTKDTDASVLQKKGLQKIISGDLKKKGLKNFFQAKQVFKKYFSDDLHERKTKKGLRKFFARFLAFFNKILTVQKIVLSSSRGQGNFWGLEASWPRPRTSKCVLEAKDVLEDSTSVVEHIYWDISVNFFKPLSI